MIAKNKDLLKFLFLKITSYYEKDEKYRAFLELKNENL